MLSIHTGFVVCPICQARFPVAASEPSVQAMLDYLSSDAQVRCPTCDTAFLTSHAKSSIELEPVNDGETLSPSPERSIDGLDNH
ncbi:hypothetical protein HUS70_00410 [Pandoraea nosoerga]|uniref:Uncharacterized protein n=1 Tax=Pandoraea nosoerga TaxID=2508296 RepID=A0A5E4RIN1_9BURK|nr:hypothetical protein [Pandoraea nosoerga]MBN4664474.1 hypothetical protein [Pandoraea nosoerga]MBN4674490.1 hypothetical protein [Pandoraea nosoerga]MBN4679758.1 hypothetical protein [Pandoraea nosoerga]MBN4743154.1 hypothetical protein [Pandoraea nosoerga]VVD63127.1 hypothetical protein PNO31109_00202 [Pandoraea nosoerga]